MSERETSGCKHCEHLSHTLTCHPPIQVFVCCQCGAKREVRVETSGSAGWALGEHGPFHPYRGMRFNSTPPTPDGAKE